MLIANELLDALPVHQVVMRAEGLREVYVDVAADGRLVTREGPVSTPALTSYLDLLGVISSPVGVSKSISAHSTGSATPPGGCAVDS